MKSSENMNYIAIDNYAFSTRIIIIEIFSSILNIFYALSTMLFSNDE